MPYVLPTAATRFPGRVPASLAGAPDTAFEVVFEGSPDGMVMTRAASGQILAVNPAFLRLVERTTDEILGATPWDAGLLNASSDADRVAAALRETETIGGVEVTLRTRQGELRTARLSMQSVVFRGVACRLTTVRDFTDLDTTRKELADALTLYRAMLRQMPDSVVMVFDRDGRNIVADGAFPRVGGPSRLLGDGLTDIVPPTMREKLEEVRTSVLAGRDQSRKVDFAGRFYEVRAMPLRDLEGKVFAGMLVVRDATTEHTLQAELRAERDFIRTVFDSTAALIVVRDLEGRVVQFNRTAERTSGYTLDEVRGRLLHELVGTPEEAPGTLARLAEAPASAETVWVTRSGERRHIAWTSTVLPDVSGNPQYIVGTGIDVTEQRRGETQLRQLAALRRAILDSANLSIISTDAAGVIRSVNATAERWLGWKAGEIIGQRAPGLVHDRGEVERRAAELSRELGRPVQPGPESLSAKARLGTPDEHEWTYIRKDGSRFPVLLTVTPLHDESGQVEGFLGVAADITERREVDRIKNEFISTVSHELRTPLTSIRGALGLLEGGVAGPLPAESREWITMARVNADRLVRLINDILDLEKMEAGRLELRAERVEAGELVRSAIEGMRGMAEEAGVVLRAFSDGTAYLPGDRDRLLQVLTNLLSNAVKFSPRDAVVEVRSERTSDGRRRFSVSDHGPGIPTHKLGNLFAKFRQLDSSDARAKAGTGLGLAISKAIVDQHHGEIGVESQPGRGTVFHFTLPAEAGLRPIGELSPESGLEILLLEDDATLARTLVQLLDGAGYRVSITQTLNEAVTWLQTHVPNLVLLDLHLPDGNGLSLVQHLRSAQRTEEVPVIVISGEGEHAGLMESPLIFDWITKPFDEARLARMLRRMVGRSRRKVLIVDDNSFARALIRGQVESLDVECLEAADGEAALTIAREARPDLIVLDLDLPKLDGFDVVEAMRQESLQPAPLLVYTGRDLSEEERGELTLGITRHLTKTHTTDAEFLRTVRELLDPMSDRLRRRRRPIGADVASR